MKSLAARSLVACALPFALAGCIFWPDGDPGGSGGEPVDPPECETDEDCAHLDTDDDACTRAICAYGQCEEDLVYSAPDCQCHTAADCDYFQKACNTVSCEAHECVEAISPAGDAAQQQPGDCAVAVCDGTSPDAAQQYDETDITDEEGDCQVAHCDPEIGAVHQALPDGTPCAGGGGEGVCFLGSCEVCNPTSPDTCGGEGPSEPQNDSGDSPMGYPRYSKVCGFSDGDDVDWYTFYASDDFFSYDVLDFDFWSTAPQIEVCAYVTCVSGSATNGCANPLSGPDGSLGCCWSGAPSTLKPSWDLDCGGFDDRGTVYISVRTPGGSACETYLMTANY